MVLSGEWYGAPGERVRTGLLMTGWIIAYAAPLALAYALRRSAAWPFLSAAPWVRLVGAQASHMIYSPEPALDWHEIATCALCGLGSALLAWWGIAEARRERINLGVAGYRRAPRALSRERMG